MGCGISKDVTDQTKSVAVSWNKNSGRPEQQRNQEKTVAERQKQNETQQVDNSVVNIIKMHQETVEPDKQQQTNRNQDKPYLIKQETQGIQPEEEYHQQREQLIKQKEENQQNDLTQQLELSQQHDQQTQPEDENQHDQQTQTEDGTQQHDQQTQTEDGTQQHDQQTQTEDGTQQQNQQTQPEDGTQQHDQQTQPEEHSGNLLAQSVEKYNKQDTEITFEQMDEHARQAPDTVKKSAEDIVNYLCSVSKDPLMLVRGIFVWITENIKYDVEGFFGRAKRAPCDSQGVLNCGRSVCEGYANVMNELCSKASIPAKKISGFAKGFGYSAEKAFTKSSKTNHAWNAVQLKGVWHLIDSTWGAGHVNSTHQFEKKFKEFYFLSNPKHFITNHFPYMDGNMEESMKWQLLDQPVSLQEFSRAVKYSPEAFLFGARALSHTNGFIEIKNELKMAFKSNIAEGMAVSARLMMRDGNILREQENATFGYIENGVSTLLVHPPNVGTYTLDVFGRSVSEAKSKEYLMTYTLKCTEVSVKDFEYPGTYTSTISEMVILRKPLIGKLQVNKKINFQIEAPYLQTIKVGKTYLEKSGNIFTGLVTTTTPGQLVVFANRGGRCDRMSGIFNFKII